MADDAPCFIADAMLGRLARWLRYLGYDTLYDSGIDDADLVRRAAQEGRILLTRDRRLLERRRLPAAVLVEGDDPLRQLRLVLRSCDPAPRHLTPRCTRCNEPLAPVSWQEAEGRVPSFVLRTRERFDRCPGCGRIYWEGTHVSRMQAALENALSS